VAEPLNCIGKPYPFPKKTLALVGVDTLSARM